MSSQDLMGHDSAPAHRGNLETPRQYTGPTSPISPPQFDGLNHVMNRVPRPQVNSPPVGGWQPGASPPCEGILSASLAARISSPLAELSLEAAEAPAAERHVIDNGPIDSVWPTQDEHESSGSESPPKTKSNIGMPPRSGYSLSDDSDSLRSEGEGSNGSGFSSTDSGSDNDDGSTEEDEDQSEDRMAQWKEQCVGLWEEDKQPEEQLHTPRRFEDEDEDTSNDADTEDESAVQDQGGDEERVLSPAVELLGEEGDSIDADDGLSSLERTFLFAKSDMAYHRILVSRCLADWIHEVDLTDAVEYVIPLLNGLGTDEVEVSAAFAPELGRLMWFFFRNCPLAELSSDPVNDDSSDTERMPRPRLSVSVFSPLLCALLLNPNPAISGATQASIVEYFLRSKQYDPDADAGTEFVTHGTGRDSEQVILEPYKFVDEAREAVLSELFDNVALAISRLDDDQRTEGTEESKWPDGDESSIAEAYAIEAGTYDEESALGRMMAVNLLAAITVEGGFSYERLVQRVVPAIISWTQDKAFFVRKEVAAAIGIIGKALTQNSDEKLPVVSDSLNRALERVLDDRVWQVRQAACYSLPGVFGTLPVGEARRIGLVSAMQSLQDDVSQNVQLAAFEMIGEVIYLFHEDPAGVPEELVRLFLGQAMDGSDPSGTEDLLADPDRALIVAFNLPAVALALGPERWVTLRDLYHSLAVHVFDNVRNSLAASLHEMARLLGSEIAVADMLPVAANLFHDPNPDVSATLLEHIDIFLEVIPVDLAKTQLQLISMLWFSHDPRDWRLRQRIAQHIETLVPRLLLADEEGCLVTVLHLALHGPVNAVRQVGIRAATRVYATFLAHDAVVADGFLGMLSDMADVPTYRQRVTFLQVVVALIQSDIVPKARFEALLLPRLTALADDRVYEVRLALAHTVRTVLESSLYPNNPNPSLVHIVARLSRSGKPMDVVLHGLLPKEEIDRTCAELPRSPMPLPRKLVFGPAPSMLDTTLLPWKETCEVQDDSLETE